MLSREDLRNLLYASGPATRFTQDFPVLSDVWMAYAEQAPKTSLPGKPAVPRRMVDLLITPDQSEIGAPAAFQLAAYLREALNSDRARHPDWPRSEDRPRELACHHFAVTARMDFDELVRVVLPQTERWQQEIRGPLGRDADLIHTGEGQHNLAEWLAEIDLGINRRHEVSYDVLWMARVIGTIAELHWTVYAKKTVRSRQNAFDRLWPPPVRQTGETTEELFQRCVAYYEKIAQATARLLTDIDVTPNQKELPKIAQVSLNRSVESAVKYSAMAVKADAARRLFAVCCEPLTWAVVDNGIDATHPAFYRHAPLAADEETLDAMDWPERSRVRATYDFGQIRALLSLDQEDQSNFPEDLKQRLKTHPEIRDALRESLQSGRTLDWDLVRPLIQVAYDEHYPVPNGGHGTHVSGILAGDWRENRDVVLQGICPDLNLLDLRVFDQHGGGDEFTVMAALQFLRHLNGESTVRKVHGVNLSLSIKHEVANYACGSTPVCNECARLVGEGIVVVAAAGNDGYQAEDSYHPLPAFRTVSITDPGNADAVITVGSTHRHRPHTYGVSYFSSRGPTGDGRLKPDLVAPGEKINSCIPGKRQLLQDGTSMAAPHVSGAAALLMARYPEFIGKPEIIKKILCETATDLGREKYFQGHGMLDILRALQSV